MSEIRNIPDVKDASGFFKFDGAKKAIIVPSAQSRASKRPGKITPTRLALQYSHTTGARRVSMTGKNSARWCTTPSNTGSIATT